MGEIRDLEYEAGTVAPVVRYGRLREDDLTDGEHGEELSEIIVEVLRSEDVTASRAGTARLAGHRPVGLRAGGRDYILEVVWCDRPVSRQQMLLATENAGAGAGTIRVLLSVPGFDPDAVESATSRGGVILLDGSHLEAVLCGLLPAGRLFESASWWSTFEHLPYPSLTGMLKDPAGDPPRLTVPGLLAGFDAASIRRVLVGKGDWARPAGLASRVDGGLLVTTAAGILEVDSRRARVEWSLPLRGCRASVCELADGSIAGLCRDAVFRWDGEVVKAMGHAGSDARGLVAGDGGELWVHSGAGGNDPRALTLMGENVGEQMRLEYHCDADVRDAAWLSGRRFHLAANGHSATLDLAVSDTVRRGGWIPAPRANPSRAVACPLGGILVAYEDPARRLVTVLRQDPDGGVAGVVAELPAFGVLGMAVRVDAVHLLLDVRTDPSLPLPPVLVELAVPHAPIGNGPKAVDRRHRMAGHGNRRDYALESSPISSGGQATVFEATHKPTGTRVAVKKFESRMDCEVSRSRREIAAARRFGGNPHVMPVLDHSATYDWYAMPLADRSADGCAYELRDTPALRAFVAAICEGLREPHREGWVHRDLKPHNVLWLDGRWVVADWGFVRRPRGQTTEQHTRAGTLLGTEGFAAPEQLENAHDVGPQADIYSIGQIIGWVLTGGRPKADTPLLPPPGPWRRIVEAATRADPRERPSTVDDLLALMARELEPRPTPAAPVPAYHPAAVSPSPTSVWQGAPPQAAMPPAPAGLPRRLVTAGVWIRRVLVWLVTEFLMLDTMVAVGMMLTGDWELLRPNVGVPIAFALPLPFLLVYISRDLRRLQARRKARPLIAHHMRR